MDAAKALKPRSFSLELETINASACGINDMPDDDWLEGAAVIPNGDFSIDDLLDFSNEQEEEKDSLSVSSPDNDTYSNSGSFSGNGEDSDLLLGSELVVPVEDIAEELEWVSQFVDDSLPLHHCPPPPIVVVCLKPPSFTSQVVPVKSRSKRSRSKQTGQSTSETSSTSSWSTTSIDLFKEEKRRKKIIKRNEDDVELQRQRRCSHCLVEKTPQWRSGPLGPKSLCNACGVRYKSGRLFPEYRPACSPSFALHIHSNSHRKVLEMRRKKETGRLCYMVSTF